MLLKMGKVAFEVLWLHCAPCKRYRLNPDEYIVSDPLPVKLGDRTLQRSAVVCVTLRYNKSAVVGSSDVNLLDAKSCKFSAAVIHPKDCPSVDPEKGRRVSFERALHAMNLSKANRRKAWDTYFGLNRKEAFNTKLPAFSVGRSSK